VRLMTTGEHALHAAGDRTRHRARTAADLWIDRFARNRLLTSASAMAFQLLIAGAALLFLAVALLHPLGQERVWSAGVGPALRDHVPTSWYRALDRSVRREFHADPTVAVALGAVVATWEMSGVVRAVMGALNAIYESDEKRSFVHRFGLSFLLALAVSALLIAAALVSRAGLGLPLGPVRLIFRLVAAAALCWAVIALLVLFAPCVRQPWRFVSAGSLAIIVAWIAISVAYGAWVRQFVDFRSVEGALAAVIITTGYLYALSIAFLVGCQLDQLVRERSLDAALGGGA
jgi:YihY family inner membrane protein